MATKPPTSPYSYPSRLDTLNYFAMPSRFTHGPAQNAAHVYTSDASFSTGISQNKRSAKLQSDPAGVSPVGAGGCGGCAWEAELNCGCLNVGRSCLQ